MHLYLSNPTAAAFAFALLWLPAPVVQLSLSPETLIRARIFCSCRWHSCGHHHKPVLAADAWPHDTIIASLSTVTASIPAVSAALNFCTKRCHCWMPLGLCSGRVGCWHGLRPLEIRPNGT